MGFLKIIDFIIIYYLAFLFAGIWHNHKIGMRLAAQVCSFVLEVPILLRIFEVW